MADGDFRRSLTMVEPTGWFRSAPHVAPVGHYPVLAGVDLRLTGRLRRWAGMLSPDSNTQAPLTNGYHNGVSYSPDVVDYCEVQREDGSNERGRCLLVQSGSTSDAKHCEIWYKWTDTSNGDDLWGRRVLLASEGFNLGELSGITAVHRFIYTTHDGANNGVLYWSDYPTSSAGTAAQAGSTSTTLVIDAAATLTADDVTLAEIEMTSGACAGQRRFVKSYVAASKVATLYTAWVGGPPSAGDTYTIHTWFVTSFGPSTSIPSGPIFSAGGAGGRGNVGNYRVAYRYYDSERRRYTPLSTPTTMGISTAGDYLDIVEGSLPPSASYDQVEIFCTVSSGSTSDPPGGPFYKIYIGAANASTGFAVRIFAAADSSTASSLNDEDFPLQYQYSPFNDEVLALGDSPLIHHWQDVTFALETRGAYYDLRWSPSFRLEPENFPSVNTFPTLLRVEDRYSCQFVPAGDMLYLFGSDQAYRIQKVGNSVAVEPILEGIPFVYRMAFARVGGTIYALTMVGLLEIDAATGAARLNPVVDEIIRERWRGTLAPADRTAPFSMSYHAELGCLFIHNRVNKETLCLWLLAGRQSLLIEQPAVLTVTAVDPAVKTKQTAMWINRYRRLMWPNVARATTQPQTNSGMVLYASAADKYNAQITNITTSGSNLQIDFGSNLFTYDGSSGLITMNGLAIWFLTGNQAGQCYSVQSNDANSLVLTATAWKAGGTPAVGDWVALDPIPLALVGCPCYNLAGEEPGLWRYKITSLCPQVTKVASTGAAAQQRTDFTAIPLPILTLGATRDSLLTQDWPKTLEHGATDQEAPLVRTGTVADKYVTDRKGVLAEDEAGRNAGYMKGYDGLILYPTVTCLLSNITFDITRLRVEGSRELTERVQT